MGQDLVLFLNQTSGLLFDFVRIMDLVRLEKFTPVKTKGLFTFVSTRRY